MKRLLILALAAMPLFATTDTFYITESGGSTTTNYPVMMGRPFVQGEITSGNYPQVQICTTSACVATSASLTTQVDVKNTWSDGSIKMAVLSFYIPTLTASSTVYFKIGTTTSCNCGTPETKTNMLANYNFDATETFSSGVTATVSAKTILTAWNGSTNGVTGPVYYWTKGTNSTTLIIADNRNTTTCNSVANSCSANDVGSDAYKAIRPEFHVTFWPLTSQVKVRFVGEITNTQAMEAQSYNISLSVGGTSPQTVFTQSSLVHQPMERWTVTRNNQSGQTWSASTSGGSITLPKEIWIGGVPSPIAINHNFAYLISTYFIPNYDQTLTYSSANIAADWTAWVGQSPSAYTLEAGAGAWVPDMGTTGGSSWIGPLPQVVSNWLHTFDLREQEIAIHTTEMEDIYPEQVTEGRAGTNINRSDTAGAGTGVGHELSISNRRGISSANGWTDSYSEGNGITFVGSYTVNWTPDAEHQPDFGSAVYMLTGDFFFLQEQMFSASYLATVSQPLNTHSAGRGPTGAEGGFWDDDPRAIAWSLRGVSIAAFIAPDTDFAGDQTYFKTLVNDFTAIEEGARCGSGDIYSWCSSSTFHGNTNWAWGIANRAFINSEANQGTTYPTLHQWFAGSAQFVQGAYAGTGSIYGLLAVAGTGTATTSGTSATVTLSNSSQCSSLYPNMVASFTQDNASTPAATITAVSCPTITLNAPLTLTAGGSPWGYYPRAESAVSGFSSGFLMYSLGRALELGYSTGNLASWFGTWFINLINDANSNPRLAFTGRVPTVDVTTGSYFTGYSGIKAAFQPEWQSVSTGYAPSDLGTQNNPPGGYPAQARPAYAMIAGQTGGGSTAWSWYVTNVNSDTTDFALNPMWAVNPRNAPSIGSAPVTISGAVSFGGGVVIH